MRYESKIFGHVDWPWWHDALIVGGTWIAIVGAFNHSVLPVLAGAGMTAFGIVKT